MLGGLLLATAFGRHGVASLVVIVDLVGLGQTYNSYSSGEMFRMRPGIVDELRRQNAYRVYVLHPSRAETRSWRTPSQWSDEEAFYFGESQFLLPPQAMRWSIRGSYDSDFSGLGRHDFSVLCSMAAGEKGMVPAVLRLGGVTHGIRFPGARPPEFPVVAKIRTFHDLSPLVLSVPDPLPPAYIVHRIRTESTSTLAAQALVEPGFDSTSEIVRVQAGGAGDHRVELEYGTPGLGAGFSLSALAWAWMAFMLTGPRLPKKT